MISQCKLCNQTTDGSHEINCPNNVIPVVEYSGWEHENPIGWECPRCGRVHAPWVAGCDCIKLTVEDNKNYVPETIHCTTANMGRLKTYLDSLDCPFTIEIHEHECGEKVKSG